MAGNDNLSVEEVLAACRAQDGSGGGAQPAPAASTPEPEQSPKPAEKPAAEKPAAKPAAAKAPGSMSVADMLAAARAEKSGGAKPAAKPVAKPEAKASPKGAPKPVAAKEPAAKDKPAGPKDTASILAAARGADKPGPITKAEAAARAKEAAPPVKKKVEAPPMPAKPDYAKVAAPATRPTERRGFLVALTAIFAGTFFLTSSLAIGFSSLAVTGLLWTLGLARFMFPNILTEPPTRFKVGFPDEYAPGQVQTKFKAQFGVWIVRDEYDGQPQIFALQSVCTHLGCTPNWLEGEQKFKCPCHGSGFYKDGINFEGPAPRPLERFAIRLADDGQLEVDKSRRFKEEVGQWSDTASFVPV